MHKRNMVNKKYPEILKVNNRKSGKNEKKIKKSFYGNYPKCYIKPMFTMWL